MFKNQKTTELFNSAAHSVACKAGQERGKPGHSPARLCSVLRSFLIMSQFHNVCKIENKIWGSAIFLGETSTFYNVLCSSVTMQNDSFDTSVTCYYLAYYSTLEIFNI